LWDELADFDAGEMEAALTHFLTGVSALIGATNATWVGLVRVGDSDDVCFGWRPRVMRLLHPAPPIEESMKRGRQRLQRGQVDVSTQEAMRSGGEFRALRLCDVTPPEWFESSFYEHYYRSQGNHDGVFVYFPINSQAESSIGLFRGEDSPRFSELEREQLAYALRGIKWFHRRLLLGHGLLLAHSPLTPTERKVLHELLQGDAEKTIAARLGQTYNGTHEHVANIYRKYGINSRSELMAIWLGKQLER
jgi:DNA-binding CsgD family transcriptional regulator